MAPLSIFLNFMADLELFLKKKSFENLLFWNYYAEFIHIVQKCYLWDPNSKLFKQWRHLSNEAENGRIYRNLEKIYFSKSIHQICLCDTPWRPSWPLSIFKIYIADFECGFFFIPSKIRLWISSTVKPLIQILWYYAWMFPMWCLLNIISTNIFIFTLCICTK